MTGGADNVDFNAKLKYRSQFPAVNKGRCCYRLIIKYLQNEVQVGRGDAQQQPPRDFQVPDQRIVKIDWPVRAAGYLFGRKIGAFFIRITTRVMYNNNAGSAVRTNLFPPVRSFLIGRSYDKNSWQYFHI